MTIPNALRVISESPTAILFFPKWLRQLSILGYVNNRF
jgi:hypothetical protein